MGDVVSRVMEDLERYLRPVTVRMVVELFIILPFLDVDGCLLHTQGIKYD